MLALSCCAVWLLISGSRVYDDLALSETIDLLTGICLWCAAGLLPAYIRILRDEVL